MKVNPTPCTAQNSDKFTIDYFNAQVVEFRQLFGSLSFWQKTEEQRERACMALGFVFLNVIGADGCAISHQENERVARIYQGTMDEYHRREAILIMAGKINLNYSPEPSTKSSDQPNERRANEAVLS